jgi:hypothetical protein
MSQTKIQFWKKKNITIFDWCHFQNIIEFHDLIRHPSTKRFIICALLYPDTSIAPINVEYWKCLIILISNLNDFSLLQKWLLNLGLPALLLILKSNRELKNPQIYSRCRNSNIFWIDTEARKAYHRFINIIWLEV